MSRYRTLFLPPSMALTHKFFKYYKYYTSAFPIVNVFVPFMQEQSIFPAFKITFGPYTQELRTFHTANVASILSMQEPRSFPIANVAFVPFMQELSTGKPSAIASCLWLSRMYFSYSQCCFSTLHARAKYFSIVNATLPWPKLGNV